MILMHWDLNSYAKNLIGAFSITIHLIIVIIQLHCHNLPSLLHFTRIHPSLSLPLQLAAMCCYHHPCSAHCNHSSPTCRLNPSCYFHPTMMGGLVVCHELEDTTVSRNNREKWQIFGNAGWYVYLDRLQGFNEAVTIEFALNLGKGISRV